MPKVIPRIRVILLGALWLATVMGFSNRDLFAQGTALQGTVTDSSGAVIPGATIAATNLETGLQRSVTSNNAGLYAMPNLPPGRYRVQVSLAGFQTSVRENIDLVVGQQLVLNMALQVGDITQEVTVTGEAPLVNTTTAQVSGLVGEREVKDLPLNGRSFDNLITLNPGTVNTTALRGASSSAVGPGNYFAIEGRRPGENTFLWNGVEYPGGAGTGGGSPGGVSGQLLGIEAVREFNVVTGIDSAEHGHRPAAKIVVVTATGTNSFHGSLFEFLRNSALDARNFFDSGSIPPFKRNQFGGSAGGPIHKDKTFVFGNYEGFRQRLGLSNVAVVPDDQTRKGLLPDAQGVYQPVAGYNPAVAPYFALWPVPNGPQLLTVGGQPTGTALSFSNPPSPIREDFGIVRFDRTFSERDTFSASYTVDEGESIAPSANPNSLLVIQLRTQVLSLTHTHIVSANVVNTFTAGYARPNLGIFQPLAIHPPGVEPVLAGGALPPRINIGGSGVGAAALTFAGPGPGGTERQGIVNNVFTYEDQVHVVKGIHSVKIGAWFQRLRADEINASVVQLQFPDLASFLQGRSSNISVQTNPAVIPWRVWEGAWYVQDAMKLRPNLTLSLGVRQEFMNRFNSRYGNAINFLLDPNGILLTEPRIAPTLFTENNARWLLGPRAGLAWDPFGNGKTSVRAGFGMAYNLLDYIAGFCCRQTPTALNFEIANSPFPVQIDPSAPLPGLRLSGSGIQPDALTPTVINYRFEIERGVGSALSLRVAYMGSHGYHDLLRGDSNEAVPTICSAAQGNCPAGLPDGTKYFPAGTPRRNPTLASTVQMYTSAVNGYNAFAVDLNRRFRGGLAFRANYTSAKSMDNASSLTSFQSIGNPALVLDNYDRGRDSGLSAFDVRNRFSFNSSYELPFGPGRALLSGATGAADKLISGWQLNGIVSLQDGFPFTPRLGFNRARNGNTSNPDRPDMAPGRTLSGIYLGTPTRWYDPTAFALPLAGTYGNAGRNILIGHGLQSFDLSLFKTTHLSERWNLHFRAEFFNLFNRANFSIPSPIALTTSGAPASAAGVITATTTTSRQMQFGLKLTW